MNSFNTVKYHLEKNPVVPVAVLESPDRALFAVELLLKYSISMIEVTLRTEEAFDCIAAIAERFGDIMVGAGSVLKVRDAVRARDAGAKFGVAPCLDRALLDYSDSVEWPFIPGISTPSELNTALSRCGIVKVFPASSIGGVEYIRSMCAPFSMVDFKLFPTGGINPENFRDFLGLDKVISCGMSYIIDRKLVSAGDFTEIEKRIIRIRERLADL